MRMISYCDKRNPSVHPVWKSLQRQLHKFDKALDMGTHITTQRLNVIMFADENKIYVPCLSYCAVSV